MHNFCALRDLKESVSFFSIRCIHKVDHSWRDGLDTKDSTLNQSSYLFHVNVFRESRWENAWHPLTVCTYPILPVSCEIKANFYSRVQLVWIKNFPSPRQVSWPSIKNFVCRTIFPYVWWEVPRWLHAFPEGICAKVKCKQPSTKFWTQIAVFIFWDDNHSATELQHFTFCTNVWIKI